VQNINKDQDELLEIVKQLCIFIRPEAFTDEIRTSGKTISHSTEIMKELRSRIKAPDDVLDVILNADAKDLESFSFIEKM
jgi:hypothetical protein